MSRGEQGHGWRVDRIPGRPVRRTAEGHYVLPLWLLYDGQHRADIDLPLSAVDAETLRAELACRLDDEGGGEGPRLPAESFG